MPSLMLTYRIVLLLLTGGLLISAALAQTPEAALASWLPKQRWQKRVVLLCAPNSATPEWKAQRQLLAAASAELQERDMVVREVLFDQLSASDQQYLTQQLRVKSSGFTLLLIGKDGGEKRRETAPIRPASLFGTIDSMPMRRQEARRPR
jgi:hypothetical protein